MADRNELGLVEALDSLRMELLRARDSATGQSLQFGLGPVEVQLQVQVTKAGEGKIGWAVLSAGGSYQRATTHTITLTLTPELELAGGGRTTNVKVTGQADTGDTFGPTSAPTEPHTASPSDETGPAGR